MEGGDRPGLVQRLAGSELISLSSIDASYRRAYDRLCGVPPHLRCWHFQWLAVKDLYRDLRRVLPDVQGRVLDVGCGEKPYLAWMRNVDPSRVVGIDRIPGPHVDMVVEPGGSWDIPDGSFDAVLCTQVLEHVEDPGMLLGEIHRVLAPGGTLYATLPFLYGEHGAPRDYRRWSLHGIRLLLENRFHIVEVSSQGGIGSTTGLLLLGWMDAAVARSRLLRLARPVFLPARIVFCLAVNAAGWFWDRMDRTGGFYSNVLVVARKQPVGGPPSATGSTPRSARR